VFALFDNTIGGSNTATGFAALGNNSSGNSNTAAGSNALLNNTTGSFNTANGVNTLLSNTTANNNTAIGYQALLSNTAGFGNTAVGFHALQSSVTGNANTALGATALSGNTAGGGNTAFGTGTLSNNTTGDSNTAIGDGALTFNTTGSENVALGEGAGGNVTTANNVICIGNDGANLNNTCFIGNIRGVTTANMDAVAVYIDSAGQLGTVSSSRRYKSDIQKMDKASQAILALEPVTFHYKSDSSKAAQFGLIAEEVAQVNPDLVVRDKNGEIYTVRYEAVNAMLLNEFLKEHRKVEQMQKEIEALTVGLQKVSAELELHKSAPQTVSINR
jgi:hypothetical protein